MCNNMSNDMIEIPILLPQMGESVSEAVVIEWLKQEGDEVARDELFVLIGTDKVESELPSEFEGVLHRILVAAGDETEVGTPICTMMVSEEAAKGLQLQATKNEEVEVVDKEEVATINKYKNSKQFLSPVVRKIATQAGLELDELEKIEGSGAHGRIRKRDILNYLNPKPKQQKATIFGTEKMDLNVLPQDCVEKLSRMQLLLAKHLQLSFFEIPHVTTFAEADVTEVVAYRDEIKNDFLKRYGTKITYTHFFQFAIVQALKKFPKLNAWMNGDEWIAKHDINLGFAASLANGDLIVPNAKAVQDLNFVDMIQRINQKAADAKGGNLNNDDIRDTTFTVSNTGMFGSLAGTPIISKPQVAVLALGQILSAPGILVEQGVEKLAIRKKMMLSISYDHRLINGAYASEFLTEVKRLLTEMENMKVEY